MNIEDVMSKDELSDLITDCLKDFDRRDHDDLLPEYVLVDSANTRYGDICSRLEGIDTMLCGDGEDIDLVATGGASLAILKNKITSVEEKVDRIEQSINHKLDPLLELLQAVIKNGLKLSNNTQNETYTETENTPVPELSYKEDNEYIYITGSKTYDNRELIKATFRGASWNKEKSAWAFRKFEDYEQIIIDVFPNIIKGQ